MDTQQHSTRWAQPQAVNNLALALGGDIRRLMPDYDSIPEDFQRDRGDAHKWVKAQQQWFFRGLSAKAFTPRDDVDPALALRHLAAIQASFEPKHEHKEAAVAYLASLWFQDVEVTR